MADWWVGDVWRGERRDSQNVRLRGVVDTGRERGEREMRERER